MIERSTDNTDYNVKMTENSNKRNVLITDTDFSRWLDWLTFIHQRLWPPQLALVFLQ